MRRMVYASVMVLAFALQGVAEDFYLKSEKTGRKYGPFKFENGAVVSIGSRSFRIVKLKAIEKKEGGVSGAVDEILVKGTINTAKSLIFPPNEVKYDRKSKTVHVSFTTPKSYKENLADYYLRWRDNQWVVLQEFKKSGILVARVVVQTNYTDGSGILRFVHSAAHVDKYAKLANDDLWLKTATMHQRTKGSTKWEEVAY